MAVFTEKPAKAFATGLACIEAQNMASHMIETRSITDLGFAIRNKGVEHRVPVELRCFFAVDAAVYFRENKRVVISLPPHHHPIHTLQ